ncbi:hypothetical protein [Streptosporangium sp. G12]
MNAATTALLDQADAAAGHALNSLHRTAHQIGSAVTYNLPGPVSTTILDRLNTLARQGALTLCSHLSTSAPQPAFWAPWAPGKIRCPPCAERAYRRIKGTREDKRCDHCRRACVKITSLVVQLPAILVNVAPLPAFVIPPVQASYGLCSGCRRADQAAA